VVGDLVHLAPAEESQFDDPGLPGVQALEPVQGVVEGEQLDPVRLLDLRAGGVQRDPLPVPAPLVGPAGPGVVDQHPPHGLGRGGEEVPPAGPVRRLPAPDPIRRVVLALTAAADRPGSWHPV
jgi:hypothetical protein